MIAGAAFAVGLALVLISAAKAEGIAKKPVPAQASVPVASGWTGCGLGLHVSRVNADVDFGAPINIGSNGHTAGVSALCDVAFDRLVLGVFVDYDRVWGDLETIGVNSDLTIGARAGVLVTQAALFYAHGGWSRIDAGSDIDGYKMGLGVEVKVPGAPVSLDFRYSHSVYADIMGSGLDASSDSFRAGLVYRFFASTK